MSGILAALMARIKVKEGAQFSAFFDGDMIDPTGAGNISTTYVRSDNTPDATQEVKLQRTIGGVTYQQTVQKNAAGEVISVGAWTALP